MSNYPKVSGFCEAGCKRRVVPYEEFLNSASIVERTRIGYTFELGKGLTYRLKNSAAVGHWGVSITVSTSWNIGNSLATGMLTVDLPTFDKYAKGLKFVLLDVMGNYDEADRSCYFSAVYEVNGERHALQFVDGTFLSDTKPTANISYNIIATCTTDYETDLRCWVYNEDAEIQFVTDEMLVVTEADNGKFMRVVNGKWAAVSLRKAEEVSV